MAAITGLLLTLGCSAEISADRTGPGGAEPQSSGELAGTHSGDLPATPEPAANAAAAKVRRELTRQTAVEDESADEAGRSGAEPGVAPDESAGAAGEPAGEGEGEGETATDATAKGAGGEDGQPAAGDPHPLYPALDLATLPLYGTDGFTYEAPELPRTTRTVTVTTRAELERECAADTGAAQIAVAADLLAEGIVTLRGSDCEIALGEGARIASLFLDSTPQRIRVSGGQIGSVSNVGLTVSDVVFDGVTFNTGLLAGADRPGMIFTLRNLSRLAVINSIGRAAPTVNEFNGGNIDGGVFYAQDANDVLLANNNFACADTATANGWFARIETGSNWLVIDNMVKVYFHKMIRLSDFHNGSGPQFDYLVARGGSFMHAHYETMYDQMSHGGESDHVFIEGVSFYVDEAGGHRITFGAQFSDQLTRSWHATDLHWYARSERVVGDAVLAEQESLAREGEDLRYRLGSPTYTYQPDGVVFPDFQEIGAFADPDPEHLPAR